jgi:hypothetical protein
MDFDFWFIWITIIVSCYDNHVADRFRIQIDWYRPAIIDFLDNIPKLHEVSNFSHITH